SAVRSPPIFHSITVIASSPSSPTRPDQSRGDPRGMPREMYQSILLRHDGAISTITINRAPLNTVTPATLTELLAAFDEVERRAETRCVVLTGSGTRAFCAG